MSKGKWKRGRRIVGVERRWNPPEDLPPQKEVMTNGENRDFTIRFGLVRYSSSIIKNSSIGSFENLNFWFVLSSDSDENLNFAYLKQFFIHLMCHTSS